MHTAFKVLIYQIQLNTERTTEKKRQIQTEEDEASTGETIGTRTRFNKKLQIKEQKN
jgi:hypothetical protein